MTSGNRRIQSCGMDFNMLRSRTIPEQNMETQNTNLKPQSPGLMKRGVYLGPNHCKLHHWSSEASIPKYHNASKTVNCGWDTVPRAIQGMESESSRLP